MFITFQALNYWKVKVLIYSSAPDAVQLLLLKELNDKFKPTLKFNSIPEALCDLAVKQAISRKQKLFMINRSEYHMLTNIKLNSPNGQVAIDITLLCKLLRIAGLNIPDIKTVRSNDKSIGASVAIIRDIRNSLAHAQALEMDNQMYRKTMTKLKKALINLGVSSRKIHNDIEKYLDKISSASELVEHYRRTSGGNMIQNGWNTNGSLHHNELIEFLTLVCFYSDSFLTSISCEQTHHLYIQNQDRF